jgi:cephalosporin hydroxylase
MRKVPNVLVFIGLLLIVGVGSAYITSSMIERNEAVESAGTIERNEAWIIEEFQKIYYTHKPYETTFLGMTSHQYPTDNWVMQEIISEIKPDFIIETGTGKGGTALFYATVLEKVNDNGQVITIDVYDHAPEVLQFEVWKERVEFMKASSVAPETIERIAERVKGKKVLVTLDADHSKDFVLNEMKLYAPLVSLNSYMVVQDTHLGGNPNHHGSVSDEGPMGALKEFLATRSDFESDHSRESHLITQNPLGFLKKVKE